MSANPNALGYIEIFKGSGLRNWRWRLLASNGQVTAQSEGYFSFWNAKRAARKLFSTLPCYRVVTENSSLYGSRVSERLW